MSRAGEVALQFGDDERLFRLGIGEWRAIQEKCDAGPFEIYARLASAVLAAQKGLQSIEGIMLAGAARLRVDDVRQVLYHGLVGGGMKPNDAGRLITELVDNRPVGEPVQTAHAIVVASLAGASDETPGESAGAPADASPRPSLAAN